MAFTISARKRADDRQRDRTGVEEVVVVQRSRWAALPIVALAALVIGLTLYNGRTELAAAASGASSMLGSAVTQIPILGPAVKPYLPSSDTRTRRPATARKSAQKSNKAGRGEVGSKGGSENAAVRQQRPRKVAVSAASKVAAVAQQVQEEDDEEAAALLAAAQMVAQEEDSQRAAAQAASRVIVEVLDTQGNKVQILDEPIPEDCHAQQHADYAGDAVQWGLGHKQRSAAECCAACKRFKERNPDSSHTCNVWVWCGDPSGVCWTMDIHKHTTGDCWLKVQKDWDGDTNLTRTNLGINHRDGFSTAFRAEHKTAPEFVPWISGVIAP